MLLYWKVYTKGCHILAGMRVESGIDVTRKEDYLSPEDFEKVAHS